MSHPDPYGTAEPRGWDRPERPLPWPENELEPGRRPAGSEAYAGPYGRPQTAAGPYRRPADGYDGPRDGRPYDELPPPGRGWRDEPRQQGERGPRGRGHRDAERGFPGRGGPPDGYDHPRDEGFDRRDARGRGYDPDPRERGYDPRERGREPDPRER
ncbi:phosphatidate cytidylyltransferase, partial [Micromonospora sp. MS34]